MSNKVENPEHFAKLLDNVNIYDNYKKLLEDYTTLHNTKVENKKLTFSEYQKQALTTAIYPDEVKVVYPALGLCSEAGEVAGKIKKVIRDCNGVFTTDKIEELGKEISDCAWYLAALAAGLGLDLGTLAEENLAKLVSRKERGTLQGSGDNR